MGISRPSSKLPAAIIDGYAIEIGVSPIDTALARLMSGRFEAVDFTGDKIVLKAPATEESADATTLVLQFNDHHIITGAKVMAGENDSGYMMPETTISANVANDINRLLSFYSQSR